MDRFESLDFLANEQTVGHLVGEVHSRNGLLQGRRVLMK
jgi:hypothetical protein